MKNKCFHESICFVKAYVGHVGGRKKRLEDGKQTLVLHGRTRYKGGICQNCDCKRL